MKTKKQITAIITVLFMGFSTLYGQRTEVNQDKSKQSQTRQAPTREVQSNPNVKQSQTRQAPTREVQSNPNVRQSTTRQTPTREVQSNPNVRQSQTRQTPTREVQSNPNVRQSQTRQTPTREVQSNPNVRQSQTRQTPTREVQSNPNVRQTQANTVQNRQTAVQPQRSPDQRNTTRYNETASRQVVTNKPVSISTPHNPKSDYRTPNTHNMKENKYSEKRYYGGHYYHHVYPGTRVKTNYHHDTYIHHYNVLYYPAYHEIFWTHNMYRDYSRWYPKYNWRYNYGYRINTISIFDAQYNMGEVAMVYGRVSATWYNRDTDDYLLFFGGDYPAQQFTVVLPGNIARRFNWRPERYFLGEHMTVTGLITTFDGIPEIIVKNKQQVGIY